MDTKYITYGLLGLWGIAFFGAIFKELLERHAAKENYIMLLLLSLIPPLLVATIASVLWIFNLPNIKNATFKIQEFGQFGDMIGGILNPSFAFISFILLLLTYKAAANNSKKEEARIERAEMRSIINELKTELEGASSVKYLKCTINKKEIYFSINEIHSKKKKAFNYLTAYSFSMRTLEDTSLFDSSGDHLSHNYLDNHTLSSNMYALTKIKSHVLRLLDLYQAYLEAQPQGQVKETIRTDLVNLITKLFDEGTLTETEYNKFGLKVYSDRIKKP